MRAFVPLISDDLRSLSDDLTPLQAAVAGGPETGTPFASIRVAATNAPDRNISTIHSFWKVQRATDPKPRAVTIRLRCSSRLALASPVAAQDQHPRHSSSVVDVSRIGSTTSDGSNANYYRGAQPNGTTTADLAALRQRLDHLTSDDAEANERSIGRACRRDISRSR